MAGTKRVPLQRRHRRRFSDETLAIYREMRNLDCTCEAPDPIATRDTECANCKRWRQLHGHCLAS